MVTGQFEHVARTVAQRAAEALGAPVLVLNEHGTVVAASDPAMTGRPFRETGVDGEGPGPRVPIRLNGRAGEVIVARPDDGEPLSPRLARAIVELTVNQTAVVDRLPNHYELKNRFIYDLLHGAAGDDTDVLREGQILGMDFARPRAVILVDAADYILAPDRTGGAGREAQVRRSVLRVRQVIDSIVSFFHLPDETICAYIGDGEIAVLKASTPRDLAAWSEDEDIPANASWADLTALKRAARALLARLRHDTGAPVSIGIGRYHPGIGGIARSYEDARAALSLGRRFHGRNQVDCLDGLGLAAFVGVAGERTKVELARHLLSPLDGEPALLETLGAFFALDCCPSSTAARLSIHRNTLGYRLDKIASLTGLDPRRFDDAVQIRLAMVLRSLQPAPIDCANAQ